MSKPAGNVLVIFGGLLFLVALTFVGYFRSVTLWELTTREPLILTLIAMAAIGLATMSFVFDAMWPPLLAACLSFYLFGQVLPIGAFSYKFAGVGFGC